MERSDWIIWYGYGRGEPPGDDTIVLCGDDVFEDFGREVKYGGRRVESGYETYVWDPRAVYITPTKHPERMMAALRLWGGYDVDGKVELSPKYRDFAENHIPALQVERGIDISVGLGALTSSSGRDTDRDWIEYTDVLHGFTYVGPYSVVDVGSYRRFPKVDVVVVRGHMGPDAEPMHPNWVRLLRDQCAGAGAVFIFLGWGEWCPRKQLPPGSYSDTAPVYTFEDGEEAVRFNPELSGAMLDGRMHLDLPRRAA